MSEKYNIVLKTNIFCKDFDKRLVALPVSPEEAVRTNRTNDGDGIAHHNENVINDGRRAFRKQQLISEIQRQYR